MILLAAHRLLGDVLVGNHILIFLVLDVSFAVNSYVNHIIYIYMPELGFT